MNRSGLFALAACLIAGAVGAQTVYPAPSSGASGAAGGDLAGSYPNPTVAQITGPLPNGSASSPSVPIGGATVGLYGDGTHVLFTAAGAETATIGNAGIALVRSAGVAGVFTNRVDASLTSPSNVGLWSAAGFNSTGATNIQWGQIEAVARVATTGSEEGEWLFQTFHPGGSLTTDFSIDNGGFYTGAFGTKIVDASDNLFALTLNKVTITAPATSATLTIANGKTLTVNNSLTLAGTDGQTETFPATSASIARIDAAQTFTGVQTFSSSPVFSSGIVAPGAIGGTTPAAGTFTTLGANTSFSLNGNLALSPTAPTIANGGGLGTVGTIVGSAAAFDVTAGTGAASVFVITLPSAAHGWVCNGNDVTTHSTTVSSVQQTVGTNNATTVTMGAYSDISALAAVGTGDHIRIACIAY